jgi:hypothetical protein
MNKIRGKLKNLGQDKTRKILGVEVTRHHSEFIISDQCYTITEAVEFIETNQSIDSKNPLDHSAFVLVRPGGDPGSDPSSVTRAFRINSNVERIALLKHAKSKNLYVYAGSIKLVDGKSRVCGPFAFLWDSMPLDTEKKPTKWPSGDVRVVKKNLPDSLDCPYCSSTFSSTSGRTLHIRSKHSEEYE